MPPPRGKRESRRLDFSAPARMLAGMIRRHLWLGTFFATVLWAGEPSVPLAEWVARATTAGQALEAVPFPTVVEAATGHRVIPLDPSNSADQALLDRLAAAMDRVLAELNRPDHPAHRERRINEASRYFEDALRQVLDADPAFACAPPKTAAGRTQRSGYPDLRLVERATGRVTYLDPKLFAARNRHSSLRTFYFQPGRATNKILDDARHVIVGIEHGGKQDGHWRFQRWELVDAARLRVRLKVEFQAANRDLYTPATVVRRSQPTPLR